MSVTMLAKSMGVLTEINGLPHTAANEMTDASC